MGHLRSASAVADFSILISDCRLGIRRVCWRTLNMGAQIICLCIEFSHKRLAVHSACSGRAAPGDGGGGARQGCYQVGQCKVPAVAAVTVPAWTAGSGTRVDLPGEQGIEAPDRAW